MVWQNILSLRLEVLLEDVVGGSFLAPVPDDAGGALYDLPGLHVAVNLAETCPFSKLHVAINLDEWDSMLHAESSDQFLVHGLITILGQNTEQSLSLVQCLGCLSHASGKTVGNESLFENLLDGGV